MKQSILQAALETVSQADYSMHSRVHPLRSFPGCCYIKRDDELSFGISGSKMRKYRTLIPSLVRDKVDTAIVIGGSHSNNVVGLVQLLLENGIEPLLFLRESGCNTIQGNQFLIRLLAGMQSIRCISRDSWETVEEQASKYADGLCSVGKRAVVIPEGANMPESFFGALTLGIDCISNEKHLGVNVDNIFIDAGTGLAAIALILAYAWMQKETIIQVVLLADDAAQFECKLSLWHSFFVKWLKHEMSKPTNYLLRYPSTARSFGTVNASILETVSRMAAMEGVLTDPIYTAKLFHTARHILETENLPGNSLIIHSGGGLALSGFQNRLLKENA